MQGPQGGQGRRGDKGPVGAPVRYNHNISVLFANSNSSAHDAPHDKLREVACTQFFNFNPAHCHNYVQFLLTEISGLQDGGGVYR